MSSSRPWSWEGRSGARNTSPGWHGFNGNGAASARSGAANAARPGSSSFAGRSGAFGGRSGSSNFTSHAMAADGNWHSFGARAGTTSTLASNVHTSGIAGVNHATIVTTNTWHGGVWGGGWHGGWGWGHPGWNWGWGWGWGCCGGWGWGGWGWGVGFGWGWGWGGWGVGWSPFWSWPGYYYNPWVYGYDTAPDVLYPYPD